MQENQISHVSNFSSSNRRGHDSSGSLKVPRKRPRNLIENAILKSIRAVRKWSVKNFLEWQNGRKTKNRAIEPLRLRAFTTDKSKVPCLDSDITNRTTELLNFYLIKFVLLILCKSKFTVGEISWNNIKYAPLLYGYNSTPALIGCWVGIIFL